MDRSPFAENHQYGFLVLGLIWGSEEVGLLC